MITGSGVIGAGAGGGGLDTTGCDSVGVGGETAEVDVNGRASISATVLVCDPAGDGDVTMGDGVG